MKFALLTSDSGVFRPSLTVFVSTFLIVGKKGLSLCNVIDVGALSRREASVDESYLFIYLNQILVKVGRKGKEEK